LFGYELSQAHTNTQATTKSIVTYAHESSAVAVDFGLLSEICHLFQLKQEMGLSPAKRFCPIFSKT
jgi:hypothetical protein